MPPKDRKPAPANAGRGPSDSVSFRGRSENSRRRAGAQHKLTFRIAPEGESITVVGREAQTLELLLQAGPRGITSGEASPLGWARRTSHYVYKLRALRVPIVTTMEDAGDARVGRYSLSGPVAVVQPDGAQ